MSRLVSLACLLSLCSAGTTVLRAQSVSGDTDGRAPRFLVASAAFTTPVRATPKEVPVLRRRVSLTSKDATLGEALATIARQAGLQLMYSDAVVPRHRSVRLNVENITVAAALTEVLLDTEIDVVFEEGDRATLVRRGKSLASATQRTGTIVGRVTDAKTGGAVASAEVLLQGTEWHTATDTAGRYRLTAVAAGNYTLTARRLGYTKQTLTVTVADERTDTVDVALEPAPTRLDELVTTATGQQRRLELANDITLLKADSIVRTQPVSSVTDLLEARVPSLTVQRTSGAPGDPARLRLRGAASPLRNNDPIVVVDGIRVYAEQSAGRSANLAGLWADSATAFVYATPSPLDYIDPNSIETIEVLKGPSAATLYGQDAANGVIVITTKKGHAGPARWTASAEHGRTQMAGRYPDLLIRWGHVPSNSTPVFCPIGNRTGSSGLACDADSLVTFQLLSDPASTVLDKGHRNAATLSVGGGSSALTYAVTGSYQQEVGLIQLPAFAVDRYRALQETDPPDWMQRPQRLTQWGGTSQVTARLGSQAEVSLHTRLSRTAQRRSAMEQRLDELMSTYLDRASGIYYVRNRNVNLGSVIPAGRDDVLRNYFQRATAGATQFTNGLNLNWRPRAWISLTADAGIDMIQRADELFIPRHEPSREVVFQLEDPDSIGRLDHGEGTSVVSTINVRANATAPLGRGFQFRFAAGANYVGTSIRDFNVQTENLAAGTSLQGSVIKGMNRSVRDDATFGWYMEPALGHRRFWLTMGLRLDGGSTYGNGLTLPKFPKLGFSYLVSDESFYPLKDLIPTLRLRVAYGRASRQPGPTDRLRLYDARSSQWVDGRFGEATELATLGNTQLRPERTTEFEGGFDADFFQDRFHLSVTGYRKTTDDALLDVPLAPSVHDASILRNIGVIRNSGFEFTVGTQLVRTGAVTWGTDLSLSQNRNVVVQLGTGVEPFYTEPSGSCNGETHPTGCGGIRVAPGYPLFGRWSTPLIGYTDANGNQVLEPEEIVLGDTAVYVGATLPNYTANLHTTVSLWHGAVAVNAGFLYEDGVSQRNEVTRLLAPFSVGQNDAAASTAEQAATIDGTDYNWIQTISTFRFNDLAVTYTVPAGMARRLGADRLSVAVQGVNLGLWTNYRGIDPSVNARATGNSVTDAGVLPQPRTWQVRVNATY